MFDIFKISGIQDSNLWNISQVYFIKYAEKHIICYNKIRLLPTPLFFNTGIIPIWKQFKIASIFRIGIK